MIRKLLAFIGLTFACVCTFAVLTMADTVDIEVDSSDGYDASCLTDDDYYSTDYYAAGTVLTVTSDTPMEYLYIMWDSYPGQWTLRAGGVEITCGEHGFLHELVKLPAASDEAEIIISEDRTYVADIYGITGDIPSWVQNWQDPYEKADILLISAHSDDEILFFGGIIPNYVNGGQYRVQVAYLCDFALTERYRQHEQLNGLWAMGVSHYPQIGEFADEYPDDSDEIYDILGYDNVLEYIVRIIRKFKPQVVVTHDFDGEYGHPEHSLTAEAVADALDLTNDPASYPESVSQYGTWDVPKAYFHLYQENQIELNARVPLEDFGGRTALEIATAAYKEHDSQQWMWFYVDDGYDRDGYPNGYEYSCTRFGLYRSLVGYDTGSDIMENLKTYDVQEAEEAEAAQAAAALTQTTETETTPIETSPAETETQTAQTAAAETTGQSTEPARTDNGTGLIKLIMIILAVVLAALIVVIIILLIVSAARKSKRSKSSAQQNNRRNKQ